jgi:hypothetical protein
MRKIRVKGKKAKAVLDELQNELDVMVITEAVTKQFEDGEWVQNEYWEEDGNGDSVMCASFINSSLDQMSVFVSEDIVVKEKKK